MKNESYKTKKGEAQNKKAKIEKQETNNKKEKKESTTRIISILAIIVSIGSLFASVYYSNKEYTYKIDPEVKMSNSLGMQVTQKEGERETYAYSERLHIDIVRKNNLQAAYLINADNEVERLKIDDAEYVIGTKLSDGIKMEKSDITCGDTIYQYKLLLLKELDNTYELYLVYTKSQDGIFFSNAVSGIEVWGMANGHKDDPQYEGERIMAEHYLEVLDKSADFLL